jgi:hypothetical protein
LALGKFLSQNVRPTLPWWDVLVIDEDGFRSVTLNEKAVELSHELPRVLTPIVDEDHGGYAPLVYCSLHEHDTIR